MGLAEIEPPPAGSGGSLFDMPLWLLVPLALMWAWFVLREPKGGGSEHGWFVPPTLITIAAFVLVAGASRWL